MPDWPSSLPDCVLDADYQEQPENNLAEFAPEVGPPLRRRRTSINSSLIQAAIVLADDEVDTLLDFYKDDLKDGSLSFTWVHPRMAEGSPTEIACFTFVTPPVLTRIAPYWRAALSLRRMP